MGKIGGLKFLSIFLVFLVILVGCTGGTETISEEDNDTKAKPKPEEATLFPKEVVNKEPEMDGGSITIAQVSDTPFEGNLDWAFFEGEYDEHILKIFSEPIFGYDNNYRITNEAESAAKFELSEDKKTMTVSIENNVYWHNGEPLEAEDYAYSFYIIGHPDYSGVRYGDPLIRDIVGMEAYQNGESNTISGIEVVDEKTVKITWNSENPALLTGVWPYASPKDHYGDVAISDLFTSDKIHTNLVGIGPFKVKNIIPGESIEFEAYEDYYGGAPKLDTILLKVIPPQSIKQELESGGIDIAEFPLEQYSSSYVPENFQFLADVGHVYTYVGFKLGHWDEKEKRAVQDKDTPLQDKTLRQAIGYAMNNQFVANEFYDGLRVPASTLMIPFFSDYHNPEIDGYTYDPDKAKQMLADAGYVDKNGDGFVETPEGKEIVLNFLSLSGQESSQDIADYYIQNWADVGIKVQLVDGSLHEYHSFYDRVGLKGEDDPKVDIFQGAWGTGTNPDPSVLYSSTALFNFSRYVNEENDRLLELGHSPEGFDQEFRVNIYNQWQQLMIDDPPVIPTLYRYSLTAVNNRVKNYHLQMGYGSDLGYEDIAITQE